MSNKIKCILVFIVACLCFILIDNVYALESDYFDTIDYAYINGLKSLDIYQNINISRTVTAGNSVNIRYHLYANDMVAFNKKKFLVTSVCGTDDFQAATNSANVSATLGKLQYLDHPIHKVTSNGCSVGGYSGALYQDVYVISFTPSNQTEDGRGFVTEASLTVWAGITTTYNAMYQVLSASLQDYDETLLQNQTIIGQNQTQIDQNQTIIDQNNYTNGQLEGINGSLNDSSIDSSSAGGFFSGFDTDDNGGISSVVTAPLVFVRKLTNQCEPMHIPFYDKDIELPCGDTLFWNKPEVSTLRDTWNLLFGGAFIFFLLKKVFKVIEDIKDPESDKVEVMSL